MLFEKDILSQKDMVRLFILQKHDIWKKYFVTVYFIRILFQKMTNFSMLFDKRIMIYHSNI